MWEAILRHMDNEDVIQDRENSFTKGKSCLMNLVAFCDGVTTSTDVRRSINVVYLEFCKALDNSLLQHPSFQMQEIWVDRLFSG